MTHRGSTIVVQVKPGAKAPGIVLGPEGAVIVRVREPATEGRANDAVRAALASALGVPRTRVTLVRGAASRHKAFAVEGLAAAEMIERLGGGGQRKP